MTEKSPVFNKTYDHYLEKIRAADLAAAAAPLGGEPAADGLRIPFFGRPFMVTRSGVTDEQGRRARFDVCIVLFKYILMCPDSPPAIGEWTAYRDFKDAAPLVHYFAANAENAVAEAFSGKVDALRRAAASLRGRAPAEALCYDLALAFDALPRVTMLMLFNDAEAGFAARCSILFRRSTASYLDMECVGILGAQLAGYLKEAAAS
ncbi:MAG: DUF3786 domain-containing protein [Desulfobacterales bacterium]|nr:MAG: DUF3786 domain-containing protein [Desulfobacterales bacterium]